MDIKYEYLEMIPEIKNMILKASSPYLSRKELETYLKVSESFVKQRLYQGDFLEGKHYFKVSKSKILFDRLKIDEWVRARKENRGKPIHKRRKDISEYLSQWSEDH